MFWRLLGRLINASRLSNIFGRHSKRPIDSSSTPERERIRIVKSVDEQIALIQRGTDQVVPLQELKEKLSKSVKTGTPLRVKYGIDPTGIDVHLGHTVPLRKL